MLWQRILRAARLDPQLYEEVEADESTLGQAMLVVVLSSLAAGVLSWEAAGLVGVLGGAVAALVSWYVWSFLTWIIGVKLLPAPTTEASYGQLLRTIGFASAPGLIRVLGVFPVTGLGIAVSFIAGVWMLAAMIVAVRQALDYESTWRAVGVCLVGWLVQAVVLGVVLALVGLGGGEAGTGEQMQELPF